MYSSASDLHRLQYSWLVPDGAVTRSRNRMLTRRGPNKKSHTASSSPRYSISNVFTSCIRNKNELE